MKKHHFHMVNGLFAISAGVIGLSGIITTFQAQMAIMPAGQPVITSLATDDYMQPIAGGKQVLGFSAVNENTKTLTVHVNTDQSASGLQFAFVPRVTTPKDVPLHFDPAAPAVQDAAVHVIDWTNSNTFTIPIDGSIAGKWITLYTFVKNGDDVGAASGLPNAIDSVGAIIFQVPQPGLE